MTIRPQQSLPILIFERLSYVPLPPCCSIHINCDKSEVMYTNVQVLTSHAT